MTSIEWLQDKWGNEKIWTWEKIQEWFEQAKEMHKQEMKKCYEHGSFALLDTGHGDTFEQYYQETFKKD